MGTHKTCTRCPFVLSDLFSTSAFTFPTNEKLCIEHSTTAVQLGNICMSTIQVGFGEKPLQYHATSQHGRTRSHHAVLVICAPWWLDQGPWVSLSRGNSLPAVDKLLNLGEELTVSLHICQHYFGAHKVLPTSCGMRHSLQALSALTNKLTSSLLQVCTMYMYHMKKTRVNWAWMAQEELIRFLSFLHLLDFGIALWLCTSWGRFAG